MNPANLPFDSESMLQGLRSWVECESPTWDAAAVERLAHHRHGRQVAADGGERAALREQL